MKAKIKKQFTPVTLELKFEDIQEAAALWHLVNPATVYQMEYIRKHSEFDEVDAPDERVVSRVSMIIFEELEGVVQ